MSYKDNTTLYILFSETMENQGYIIAHFNDFEEDHRSPNRRIGGIQAFYSTSLLTNKDTPSTSRAPGNNKRVAGSHVGE